MKKFIVRFYQKDKHAVKLRTVGIKAVNYVSMLDCLLDKYSHIIKIKGYRKMESEEEDIPL